MWKALSISVLVVWAVAVEAASANPYEANSAQVMQNRIDELVIARLQQ